MDGAVAPLRDARAGAATTSCSSTARPTRRGCARCSTCRTARSLLSHNVTPARWLWDHEPQVAIQCALGRRRLPEFAARVDAVAGVSRVQRGRGRVGRRRAGPVRPRRRGARRASGRRDGPPTLLFVGRLAPHKRQDELIRLVALLRRHRLPDARLVLVGEPLNEPLPRGAARRWPTSSRRARSRSSAACRARRSPRAIARRARFVSLSEHEGFCIPLLEAFHFGVPVVARPSGGGPGGGGRRGAPVRRPRSRGAGGAGRAGGRGRPARGGAPRAGRRTARPPTRPAATAAAMRRFAEGRRASGALLTLTWQLGAEAGDDVAGRRVDEHAVERGARDADPLGVAGGRRVVARPS